MDTLNEMENKWQLNMTMNALLKRLCVCVCVCVLHLCSLKLSDLKQELKSSYELQGQQEKAPSKHPSQVPRTRW